MSAPWRSDVPEVPAEPQPVPVPPPVDALLKLGNDVDYLIGGLPALDWNADAAAARIKTVAQGLWAAGVTEGRRQATEERGCGYGCGHPWEWHARGRCEGDLLSCSCTLSRPGGGRG